MHRSATAIGAILTIGLCIGGHAAENAYMEVWPLVLTSGHFRLRIPTDSKTPPPLDLEIQILSQPGNVLRIDRAVAQWRNVRWPQDIWAKARLPTGSQPRGAWIAEIPIAPIRPGSYRFLARVTAPPRFKDTVFADPDVSLYPQPDWLHANAGTAGLQKVLKPWTPVQTKMTDSGRVLSCWNRTMALSDSALLEQITSGETHLFAAPMQLHITDADGRTLQPQAAWKVADRADTHITLRKRWDCPNSHADVTLTHEYDGLTWLQIDLSSETGITGLEVKAYLNRDVAPFIYYFPDLPWYFGNINNVIRSPRPGMGWSASWRRWIWLGGMDAGLFCWLPDTDHWQNPHEPDAITVNCKGDALELILRVLEGPQTTTQATYELALQATPVKPWPRNPLHNRVSTFNWRPESVLRPYSALGEPFHGMKYIDRLKQVGHRVIHLGEWWTTSWGGTEPREPKQLRRLTQQAHQRGMHVIVYFGYEVDERLEAFKKFPWEIVGGDPRLKNVKEHRFYPPARYNTDIPSRKAYAEDRSGPEMERILAGMETLLRDYDVDGFYLDGTQLPTGSLRRARQLMKRMRYLVDKYATRGVIYAHTSSRNNIAVNGFADVVYDGEQLRSVPRFRDRDTLAGVFPRDYFFLVMNGRPWGVPHDLCAHGRFIDAALLLDTGTQTYQWSESYWPLQKIWLEADLWHAEYVPPHIAGDRWKERPRDVFVSYYHSADGTITVILFSDRAAQLQVELPITQIVQVQEAVEPGQPHVAYCREDVQWQADGDIWRGSLPACAAVVLQAKME